MALGYPQRLLEVRVAVVEDQVPQLIVLEQLVHLDKVTPAEMEQAQVGLRQLLIPCQAVAVVVQVRQAPILLVLQLTIMTLVVLVVLVL